VRFTIDLRAPVDADRLAAAAAITAALERIALSRQVDLALTQTHEAAATACAPWLRLQLASALEAHGIAPFQLPSGAGHDAMAMAALCPVGMLFIRCKGGISHTPEESITAEDAEMGVEVLATFLRGFMPDGRHV
jgi:allantoate deiminase